MNQPLVRVLLCPSACDVSSAKSATVALTAPVSATLIISEFSPSAHATPSLLLPFSSHPSTFA